MGNSQSLNRKSQPQESISAIQHHDISPRYSAHFSLTESQPIEDAGDATYGYAAHEAPEELDALSVAPSQSSQVGPMRRRPRAEPVLTTPNTDGTWWNDGSRPRQEYIPALTTTNVGRNVWPVEQQRLTPSAAAALRAIHRVSNPPMYPDILEVPEEGSDHSGSLRDTHRNVLVEADLPVRPLPSPLAEALRVGLGRSSSHGSKSERVTPVLPREEFGGGQGNLAPMTNETLSPDKAISRRPTGETDRERLVAYWAAQEEVARSDEAHSRAASRRHSWSGGSGPRTESQAQPRHPTTLTAEERLAQGWTSQWMDRRGMTPDPEDETPPTPESAVLDPYIETPLREDGTIDLATLAPYGLQPSGIAGYAHERADPSPVAAVASQPPSTVPPTHSTVPVEDPASLKVRLFTPPRMTRAEDPLITPSSDGWPLEEDSSPQDRIGRPQSEESRRVQPEYVTQLEGPPAMSLTSPEPSLSLRRETLSPPQAPSGLVAPAGAAASELPESRFSQSSASAQSASEQALRQEIEGLRSGPSTKRNSSLIQDLFRPQRLSQHLGSGQTMNTATAGPRSGSFFAKFKGRVRKGSDALKYGTAKLGRNQTETSGVVGLPPTSSGKEPMIPAFRTPSASPWARDPPNTPQKSSTFLARARQVSAPPAMASTTTFPNAPGQDNTSVLGASDEFMTETSHSHHPQFKGYANAPPNSMPRAATSAAHSNRGARSSIKRSPRQHTVGSLRRPPSLSSSHRSARSKKSSAASLRRMYQGAEGTHAAAAAAASSSKSVLGGQNAALPKEGWEDIVEEGLPQAAGAPSDSPTLNAQDSKRFKVKRKMVPLGSYFGWARRPSKQSSEGEGPNADRQRASSEPPRPLASSIDFPARDLNSLEAADDASAKMGVRPTQRTQESNLLSTPMCASSNSSFSSLAPPQAPQPLPPKRPPRPRRRRTGSDSNTGSQSDSGKQDSAPNPSKRRSNQEKDHSVSVPIEGTRLPIWDDTQVTQHASGISSPHGTLATILSVPFRAEDEPTSRVVSPEGDVLMEEGEPEEAVTSPDRLRHRRAPSSGLGSNTFRLTPPSSVFGRPSLTEEALPFGSSRGGQVGVLTPVEESSLTAAGSSSHDSRSSLRAQVLVTQGLGLVHSASTPFRTVSSNRDQQTSGVPVQTRSEGRAPRVESPSLASSQHVSVGHGREVSSASSTKHAGDDQLIARVRVPSLPGPNISLTSAKGQVSSSAALARPDPGATAGRSPARPSTSESAATGRLTSLLDGHQPRASPVGARGLSTGDGAGSTLPQQRKVIDGLPSTGDISWPSLRPRDMDRASWISADGPWSAEIRSAKATPPVKGYADPQLSLLPKSSFNSSERLRLASTGGPDTASRDRPPTSDEERSARYRAQSEPLPPSQAQGSSPEVPMGGIQASLAALNALESDQKDREHNMPSTSRLFGSNHYALPAQIKSVLSDSSDYDTMAGSRTRRKAAPYPSTLRRRQDARSQLSRESASESGPGWGQRRHRPQDARRRYIPESFNRHAHTAVVSSTGLDDSELTSTSQTDDAADYGSRLRPLPAALRTSEPPRRSHVSRAGNMSLPVEGSTRNPRRPGRRNTNELIEAWEMLSRPDWHHFVTPPRRMSLRTAAALRVLSQQERAYPESSRSVRRANRWDVPLEGDDRRYSHAMEGSHLYKQGRSPAVATPMRRDLLSRTVPMRRDIAENDEDSLTYRRRRESRPTDPADTSITEGFDGTQSTTTKVNTLDAHRSPAHASTSMRGTDELRGSAVPFPTKYDSQLGQTRRSKRDDRFYAEEKQPASFMRRQKTRDGVSESLRSSRMRPHRQVDEFGAYISVSDDLTAEEYHDDKKGRHWLSYGPTRSDFYLAEQLARRDPVYSQRRGYSTKDRHRKMNSREYAQAYSRMYRDFDTYDDEDAFIDDEDYFFEDRSVGSTYRHPHRRSDRHRESSLRLHARRSPSRERVRQPPRSRKTEARTDDPSRARPAASSSIKSKQRQQPSKKGYERTDILAWQLALGCSDPNQTSSTLAK